MKEENIQTLKNEIQHEGLNKIKKYFELTDTALEQQKPEVLKQLYNMARLGMTFEREMNVNKRANEMNFIRISNLVNENKEEMKKYIKASLPNYF